MTEPLDYDEATRQQINAARAQTYDNIAVTQEHVKQANASAAATSADRAAIMAVVQQAVTVDTSVGTRVMAGATPSDDAVMIYGDTGWRDVSDSVNEGWTAKMLMRRENSTVFVVYHSIERTTGSQHGNFLLLPVGFRPYMGGTNVLTGESRIYPAANGSFLRDGGGTNASSNGMISFSTGNNWPGSLPGIAA